MGPDLWELYEYGEADDEVSAIIRLAHFGALPPGVRVITQFEQIITVRLHRGDIPKISGAPETAGMTSGDTYFGADLEFDAVDSEALPANSAIATDQRRADNMPMTGRGIVIGVVDWGFDFCHPDFRRSDGSSRILALWDQRGGKQKNSPQPFGYGVVHTREAINKALTEKEPFAALGYHPADADTGIGCHGTHVASIAAGTGGEGHAAGIAPEADLVFVHNTPWDALEKGKLGDSVTLLEAIDFIARTAAGRPWVINLSMGRHGEQHDGTTLIEQGLDAAVRSGAGRAICLSAGNYYNKRTHASGQLRATQQRSLAWVINEKQPSDYNQLEVWYSWQDKFEVSVCSPDGSIVAKARLGEKVKLLLGGKEIGNLYHRAQEPNTLDHHVTVYLYKTAPAGEWTVTLTGADVIHGNYHAWIEREVNCPRCQSHFRDEDADPTSTTGTICNGRRTIAVGAYDAHDPGRRIGAFSSVGPTRDGRLKPDLCAPGVSVLAARSARRDHPDDTPLCTRMSGTSMAAPHVAGAIALAFQAAVRPLRIEETRNLLLGTTQRAAVEGRDQQRVGIGFLDIAALVDAAAKVDDGRRTFVPVADKHVAPTAAIASVPAHESTVTEALFPTVEIEADIEAALSGRQKRVAVHVGGPTPIESESEGQEVVTEKTPPDPTPESDELEFDAFQDMSAESLDLTDSENEIEYFQRFRDSTDVSDDLPDSESEIEYLQRIQEEEDAFLPSPALAHAKSAREVIEALTEDATPPTPSCLVIDQFPLNRAEIQPAHKMVLAQAARDILAGSMTAVSLVGHASQDGDAKYNVQISQRRAESAKAALRVLLDQAKPGSGKGVTFTIEARGETEPLGLDHAKNRRVQICLPRPALKPTPNNIEARLRALLSASMVLKGNPGALFTANALPSALPAKGKLWNYHLRFAASGLLEAEYVRCLVEHHPGHQVPGTVLANVTWSDVKVRITAGGSQVTIPLRKNYLLGSFHSTSGRIGPRSHHIWRLESVHDLGTAVVFGFDLTNPHSPVPLRRFEDFSREGAPSGRGIRVLVVCELVACMTRPDYEPGGVLEAARIYPIAEIITDSHHADIEMSVVCARPEKSGMKHGWYDDGRYKPSLYVDRNSDQGLVAFATSFRKGGGTPVPTWDNVFDYFDRNESRAAVRAVVVDPALNEIRKNKFDRVVHDVWKGKPRFSTVMKVPRQGEFDNIHIAPQMQVDLNVGPINAGSIGVSMAPLCAHDCFHMHWRWGLEYKAEQALGWGPNGPYTEAGAPMVAPNQKIELELFKGSAAFRYKAIANRQKAGDWAVIMPHGASYGLRLSVDPMDILDRIFNVLPDHMKWLRPAVGKLVGAAWDRAWAWIYFFLQYRLSTSVPFVHRVVVLRNLDNLRKL